MIILHSDGTKELQQFTDVQDGGPRAVPLLSGMQGRRSTPGQVLKQQILSIFTLVHKKCLCGIDKPFSLLYYKDS